MTRPTIPDLIRAMTDLDELEGFVTALRNPDLTTKTPTEEDWRIIAEHRIHLQRRQKA